MAPGKKILLKQLGEPECRWIQLESGKDDLNHFLVVAAAKSQYPYFWDGSMIVVNGKITRRNITLQDGDAVILYPAISGG